MFLGEWVLPTFYLGLEERTTPYCVLGPLSFLWPRSQMCRVFWPRMNSPIHSILNLSNLLLKGKKEIQHRKCSCRIYDILTTLSNLCKSPVYAVRFSLPPSKFGKPQNSKEFRCHGFLNEWVNEDIKIKNKYLRKRGNEFSTLLWSRESWLKEVIHKFYKYSFSNYKKS